MNSAELVNLILEKLRRVELLFIGNPHTSIRFRWGGNEYTAVWLESGKYVAVYRWADNGHHSIIDNYQQWVEGVLNGKTRDEDGALS